MAYVTSTGNYTHGEITHSTQDYITPVEDGQPDAVKMRSPAQLSPKLKRPRAVLAGECTVCAA